MTQGNVKAEDRERLETTGDYLVDEKHKTAQLTETGMAKSEKMLAHRLVPGSGGLYDPANMPLLHHIQQALRAHTLFRLDVEYMVKDGQVVIVDEFTGRLMPGRRWSDGLHQAVEAKEKVKIERENQTLATITFQNYFRKYNKLSGMTGTAETEAEEFNKIYKLDVIVAPPNRPLLRKEEPDSVYRTEREKYDAIINDIVAQQESGRPSLVGTVSIEKSEKLSGMLKRRGVKHVVLNAKYHAQEAEIVAQAGRRDAVTIATNMAGRGTDILLGGNPEFMARQQCARRSDRRASAQGPGEVRRRRGVRLLLPPGELLPRAAEGVRAHLRGVQGPDRRPSTRRSSGSAACTSSAPSATRRAASTTSCAAAPAARAIPGSSRFYLSLEDDLMRIFGSGRISGLMQRLGMEEGVPIEHGMVTKAIERAQKQVEAQNFATRKHLLEYDDVMNKQRENVYSLRRELLEGQIKIDDDEVVDTRGYVMALAEELVAESRRHARRQGAGSGALGPRRAVARGERSVRDRAGTHRGARASIELPPDEIASQTVRPCGRAVRREGKDRSRSIRRSCAASSATSCCRSSTRSGRITSTASTI